MSFESPGLLAPLSKPTTQTSPHVHSGNAAPMQQGAWISLLIPKEEAEPNQCLSQRCACASSSPRSSQISHHHAFSSGGVNRARSRFFGVTSHVVIVQEAGEAMEKYILPRRGNLYFIMFTVRYRMGHGRTRESFFLREMSSRICVQFDHLLTLTLMEIVMNSIH